MSKTILNICHRQFYVKESGNTKLVPNKCKSKMLDEIEFYYNLLKVFGLMAVYYDKHEKCYKVKNYIKYYIYSIALQIIYIISIASIILCPETFIFKEYKKTGNIFNNVATNISSGLCVPLCLWWILQ